MGHCGFRFDLSVTGICHLPLFSTPTFRTDFATVIQVEGLGIHISLCVVVYDYLGLAVFVSVCLYVFLYVNRFIQALVLGLCYARW